MCVQTNVGYCVVAEFVVQQESAEYISEALGIIKLWNPNWSPSFIMVDYSEAEILALESTFPAAQVYLCDFHREQAWVRWVRDHKHGLTNEEGEELLQLLRECAHASPADASTMLPHDAHYKAAVQALTQSPVWKKHYAVQQWLTANWLGIPQVSKMSVSMYSVHIKFNASYLLY